MGQLENLGRTAFFLAEPIEPGDAFKPFVFVQHCMLTRLQTPKTRPKWLTADVWRRKIKPSGWMGPVGIALASIVMLWWSWGKWPDVLVDFGRELYLAWRLAEGETLYTDLANFKGPLSPYLNAMWFRLFGASLRTLVVCNLVILSALITMQYRILVQVSNRLSATIASLTFVGLFAFGQLTGYGNYNYVSPYAHEITHGLTLSILSVLLLARHIRTRGLLSLAGAGLALGLAFLTDAQVFIAAFAAVITGLVLTFLVDPLERRRSGRLLGIFFVSAILPVAVAFGLLCLVMPARVAFRGVLGASQWIFHGGYVSQKFYLWGTGLLDVRGNVETILEWTIWYAVTFGTAAGLSLYARVSGSWRIVFSAALFLLVAGLLEPYSLRWGDAVVSPMPLVMVIMGLVWLIALFKHRQETETRTKAVLTLVMLIFASGLLGKMVLFTRIAHYGFVMAMPATLLLVVAVVGWVPDWLDRRGGYGGLFRAIALAIISVVAFACWQKMNWWFATKTVPVASGGDAFLSDWRALAVEPALREISRRFPPGATLAVLPEGVMLNYLSRRVNPTPYTLFMLGDLIVFGEDRMLSAFQEHPPDCIALVHKDTSEYGPQFFGRDYGQRLFNWINENYREVWSTGAQPFRSEKFGIQLLERTPRPVATTSSSRPPAW